MGEDFYIFPQLRTTDLTGLDFDGLPMTPLA